MSNFWPHDAPDVPQPPSKKDDDTLITILQFGTGVLLGLFGCFIFLPGACCVTLILLSAASG